MPNSENHDAALADYRVLDLTTDTCAYCGKILADLGADVIRIEPPGGDPSRNTGPFYKEAPDPEKNLNWWAYNTSKRGVTLNLETAEGKDLLRRLANTADALIESFPPGYMDSLGLGYAALSEANPGIIVTSISAFGQTGPYRDWKGPDIVGWALGGQAFTTGDEDRAPCRISFPQAYLHAANHAASATLAALYHREITGEGQYIDVSMQEAVVWTLMCSTRARTASYPSWWQEGSWPRSQCPRWWHGWRRKANWADSRRRRTGAPPIGPRRWTTGQ